MRLIDLSVVVMAVASLLFPSPVGNLGVAYKVVAVVLGVASFSRLNWQVLPALSVLAARFVCAEYFQISTSGYLSMHIPSLLVAAQVQSAAFFGPWLSFWALSSSPCLGACSSPGASPLPFCLWTD